MNYFSRIPYLISKTLFKIQLIWDGPHTIINSCKILSSLRVMITSYTTSSMHQMYTAHIQIEIYTVSISFRFS